MTNKVNFFPFYPFLLQRGLFIFTRIIFKELKMKKSQAPPTKPASKMNANCPSSESSDSSTSSGTEGGMEDDDDDVRYRPGYVPPRPEELLSDGCGDTETSEDSETTEDEETDDAEEEAEEENEVPPPPPPTRIVTRNQAKRQRDGN